MGWKIAICDDDAGQAARLQADVTDWAHGACAVTCFPSAEAFRFAGDTDWDILLLDVEMPGMSGIDLAKRLRGAGCRAEIIFITSHFECMAEGYEHDHDDSLPTSLGECDTSGSPIFFAAGPGFKKGFTTDRVIRQVDVAPTIATILGVRMPAQAEGAPAYQVLEELF